MKKRFFGGRVFNAFLSLCITILFMATVVVVEQITQPKMLFEKDNRVAVLEPESTSHRLAIMLGGNLPHGMVQGFTVFLFVFGLFEVKRSGDRLRYEKVALGMHLLPEQDHQVLYLQDVIDIQKDAIDREKKGVFTVLIDIIKKTSTRYLANRSASEAQDTLKDLNEIHSRRFESEFDLIRYLNWAIPICGFLGTVIGMAGALSYLVDLKDKGITEDLTRQLYLAYDTTIIGIVLSLMLMALYHNLVHETDKLLSDIQDFVLGNFVNKLRKSSSQ